MALPGWAVGAARPLSLRRRRREPARLPDHPDVTLRAPAPAQGKPRRRRRHFLDAGLEALVRGLDAGTLADLLLELARQHEPVRQRLQRLRLSRRAVEARGSVPCHAHGWRRGSPLPRLAHDAGVRTRKVRLWVDQVRTELLPVDPQAALGLATSLIESDEKLYERIDDSNGVVADALRDACRLWLLAAAACLAARGGWTDAVMSLVRGDGYGIRDELLAYAASILTPAELRALADHLEGELADLVRRSAEAGQRPPAQIYSHAGWLKLLAGLLADPAIEVRAVLHYSPEPNAMQRQSIAEACLRAGRPADALPWLETGDWSHHETTRLALRARVTRRAGPLEDSARLRRDIFDMAPGRGYAAALARAAAGERAGTARGYARSTAAAMDAFRTRPPCSWNSARSTTQKRCWSQDDGRLDGNDYPTFSRWPKSWNANGARLAPRSAIARCCWAFSVDATRKRTGHAARYFRKLEALSYGAPATAPDGVACRIQRRVAVEAPAEGRLLGGPQGSRSRKVTAIAQPPSAWSPGTSCQPSGLGAAHDRRSRRLAASGGSPPATRHRAIRAPPAIP